MTDINMHATKQNYNDHSQFIQIKILDTDCHDWHKLCDEGHDNIQKYPPTVSASHQRNTVNVG